MSRIIGLGAPLSPSSSLWPSFQRIAPCLGLSHENAPSPIELQRRATLAARYLEERHYPILDVGLETKDRLALTRLAGDRSISLAEALPALEAAFAVFVRQQISDAVDPDVLTRGLAVFDPAPPTGFFLFDPIPRDTRPFGTEDFTSDQMDLAEAARRILRERVVPRMRELERPDGNFTVLREVMAVLAENGMLGPHIPEAFGGTQTDLLTAVAIGREFAGLNSVGITAAGHTGIGTTGIVEFGTDEQKRRWLPDLAAGRKIAAFALSEPGSGSDAFGAMASRATYSDDGKSLILNGSKTFITNGPIADVFTVFIKVDGQLTAVILERGMEGFTIEKPLDKMGLHGSATSLLAFSDVRVPIENILGRVGEGKKIAMTILNPGRLKLALAASADLAYAINLATAYAKERQQFGQPIANFGMVQGLIAEAALRCFVAESASYRTLGEVDTQLEARPEDSTQIWMSFGLPFALIKRLASDNLGIGLDQCQEIFGGNGFMAEYPIERLVRDARASRIYEGTNEIQQLRVMEELGKKLGMMMAAGGLPSIPEDADHYEAYVQSLGSSFNGHRLEIAARRAEVVKHLAQMAFQMIQDSGQFASILENKGHNSKGQFLVHALADLVQAAYATESVVARAVKIYDDPSYRAQTSPLVQQMTEVYTFEALQAMKQVVADLATHLFPENAAARNLYEERLAALDFLPPADVIALRREIGREVFEREP